jgi:hypothetical protein
VHTDGEVVLVEYVTSDAADDGGFKPPTRTVAVGDDGDGHVVAVCRCGDQYELDLDALIERQDSGIAPPVLSPSARGVRPGAVTRWRRRHSRSGHAGGADSADERFTD